VRREKPTSWRRRRPFLAIVALVVCCGTGATFAHGERTQQGNLIASLDGGLSPLQLPRDHPAPVTVHLEGGLQTTDGSLLPRVTRLELGLPGQGVLDTRGLAACPPRKLRHATPEDARAACRPALVGEGRLRAQVQVPHQPPFTIHASLLAFNSRLHGRRAVVLHAFSADPPTVVVLPFILRLHAGRFRTVLVADLPGSLGPWPHFAHFEMSFFRRYVYRGRAHSYISASCPLPKILTAGFIPFARATYTLAGGRKVSTSIVRGCRAR
jgi:hypothetical protein